MEGWVVSINDQYKLELLTKIRQNQKNNRTIVLNNGIFVLEHLFQIILKIVDKITEPCQI